MEVSPEGSCPACKCSGVANSSELHGAVQFWFIVGGFSAVLPDAGTLHMSFCSLHRILCPLDLENHRICDRSVEGCAVLLLLATPRQCGKNEF